ncbi:MAG: chemotaxis protein CheD [Pirellulales bacterium]|nr:chemotaxis protein CheD [Pirellulales bacterium]
MTTSTIAAAPAATQVGMGQTAVAQKPNRLTAVLGSCVGVVLHHPRLQVGALAHVVLPDSSGRAGAAAKFADSAVPHMLELLGKHGAFPSGMVAKLAGGSCMFGSGGPLQIGEANIKAATLALEAAGIKIVGRDLGGSCGRRIGFDPETGQVTVESVGLPPRVI